MSGKTNPYAPPATDSQPQIATPSMETLREEGAIHFTGAMDERSLRSFLLADGHVGCGILILLGLSVGFVSIVLLAQGGGLAAIAIGAMGLLLVTSVVSTIPYRRLVFESSNPHWRDPASGRLDINGIHTERSDGRAFYRWDWYWRAVVGEDWVAFLPATQTWQPLFLTSAMVENLDDWNRVREVAAAVAAPSNERGEQLSRQNNFRLLRYPDRGRSVTVPPDAIPFRGMLRTEDFERLPTSDLRRQKPARWYIVVATLAISGALIVAGISSLLLARFEFLPALIVIYLVLATIGIAVRKLRGDGGSKDVVYFLNAFATETAIVSDFGVTMTEVPWANLQVIVQTDHRLALRRRRWGQFVMARRDMFDHEEDWERFNSLADRQLSDSRPRVSARG